jgi:hypothetical protein
MNSIQSALQSSVISGGTAALIGWNLSLAVPAMVAGVAISALDSVVHTLLKVAFVNTKGVKDAMFFPCVKTAVVLAIASTTVIPLVGTLGTAYKVSLLGSFLFTWIGNSFSWNFKDINQEQHTRFSPTYCLLPAPFLALLGARASDLIALASKAF